MFLVASSRHIYMYDLMWAQFPGAGAVQSHTGNISQQDDISSPDSLRLTPLDSSDLSTGLRGRGTQP